jgi:hypothetical protein
MKHNAITLQLTWIKVWAFKMALASFAILRNRQNH